MITAAVRRATAGAASARAAGQPAGGTPPAHAGAILNALDIGMELLATLAPEHCPPELFGVALRLLAGMEADP
jgi:hypothetical protein